MATVTFSFSVVGLSEGDARRLCELADVLQKLPEAGNEGIAVRCTVDAASKLGERWVVVGEDQDQTSGETRPNAGGR